MLLVLESSEEPQHQTVLNVVMCRFNRRGRQTMMAAMPTGSQQPQQWLACTKSVALIETAHAHAVPRATSTLMVVL